MPQYFFHLHHEGIRFTDESGQDLTDLADAQEAAQWLALDLMDDRSDGATPWLSSHLEVTDSNGRIVLELCFLRALETSRPPH
jgi:hypothetical protein